MMSNHKLSHILVLISLFLFLSACATTTYDKEGRVVKEEGFDVQSLIDTAKGIAPIVKGLISSPEQDAAPAAQPTTSNNVARPTRRPSRAQPASRTTRKATRKASGRTSQRNNKSNNSNRSSKKSRSSSCNSNNNQGTCR